jgi:hypothetical protein
MNGIYNTTMVLNEQSPLILKGLTEHIKDHDIDIGKLGPSLEQAQKGVGVKPGNGIPTLFSCI